MVNSTIILRYLEKNLGFRFNELEISSEEIIENIQTDTLELFSKYFPYVTRHIINTTTDLVENTSNEYYIDIDLDILAVRKVYLDNNLFGNYYDTVGYQRNILDFKIASNLLSMCTTPITFKFNYPNKLEIFTNVNNSNVLVELGCVHPKDFSTIPQNLKDEFLKLALYDTKEVLYQIRHRFANLETGYGNIELFIDDLQSATDKKEELLEKWRRQSYKTNRKKIYIY